MNLRRAASTAALTTGCLVISGAAASVDAGTPRPPAYTMIDVGTFGGPHAELDGQAVQIPRRGTILGTADTTVPDPDFPNVNPFFGDPNPFVMHAFQWQHGQLLDLGALPGSNSSAVFEVNRHGVGAGMSETGALDPINGYPAIHAVLFKRGGVVDLGVLPGGTGSVALAINNRGQVGGFANNGVPDPFSMLPFGTQTRAFIWQNGVMHDLGTLGGPDAITATLNARGQIAGDSYLDNIPDPVTNKPTSHPFLWTAGHMRDLGTLGGSQSQTAWLNDRGQVVGQSTIVGDQVTHPFLWDGQKLRDLGTLGGDFAGAANINDDGGVVGFSRTAGNNTAHAFLWKRGRMTDLTGADNPSCTFAEWINDSDQVVGGSCSDGRALVWRDGKEYHLDDLVGPTDVHLIEAAYISDSGEISAVGLLPNGDQHVFLLTPKGHR